MSPRTHKFITITAVLLTLATLLALLIPGCRREVRQASLQTVATPEPSCIPCGTDPATGAPAICCKENIPPHVIVKAEMRQNGVVLDSLVIETFVQASITPTNQTITVSIPVNEFTQTGDLWLNARYAYDQYEEGVTTGWVDEDGNPLPQVDGYSLFGAIYRFYLQLLEAVIQ